MQHANLMLNITKRQQNLGLHMPRQSIQISRSFGPPAHPPPTPFLGHTYAEIIMSMSQTLARTLLISNSGRL